MKKNNGTRGSARSNSRSGNPGIHNIDDQFNARRVDRWQPIVGFISISSNKATVSEGGTVTFTVNVEGLSDGSTIYWTTDSLNGTITNSDFVDNATTGSATVAAGTATIVRSILFDGTAEVGDAFRLLIRTGSVSGPVVLGSTLVEIIQSTVSVVANLTQPYSATEGQTIQWTVNTTAIENGTVLYYTISGAGTADFTTDVNSGSFTINSSTGTFSLTVRRDLLTEGVENFIAQIRQGSTGGSVIATCDPVPVSDISMTPVITPVATTINEGSTAVFNITTTGVADATNLYWTVESATMTAADFSTAMSGTVSIYSNAGTVNITPLADRLSEPAYAGILLDGTGLNGSLSLNGSGQYLTVPANTAFSFGSGDFTVEMWFRSSTTLVNSSLISVEDATTGWSILLNSTTGDGKVTVIDGGLGVTHTSTLGGYCDGKWHHVAWVKNGTNSSLYVDGVSAASTTAAGSSSATSTFTMKIGSSFYASRDFQGQISSIRIIKGVAAYTTAFTRPTTTLVNTSSTVLLMNFLDNVSYLEDDSYVVSTVTAVGTPTWSALSPLITDNSSYKYALTRPIGTAEISTTQAKYGTTSLRFNGDGVIRTPASNFGIGNTTVYGADFTLEAWVWIDSTTTSSRTDNLKRVSIYEYTSDQASLPWPYYAGRMFIDGTTSTCGTGIGLQDDYSGTYSAAVSITNDAWHHLVWQRVGTTLYAYVDGTRYTLTTAWGIDRPMGYSSATNNIGGSVNSSNHNYFKGYIDDLRLTPYAVYSGTTITPPVAALPNSVTAPETFFLNLKRDPGGAATGVIVANSVAVSVTDTSVSPTITANTTSINENGSVLFSISTSGIADGTTLYWTLAAVSGIALTGDLSDGALSGSVTINSNAATVTRQWALDTKTEGRERWVLQLRTISTSGAIIATSPVVRVGDTSQGTGEAILVFPVASPAIQWYVSPQLTATGTYANTNLFDFTGVLDQVPPWQKWKNNYSGTTSPIEVLTYTRPTGGGTRKYLRMPYPQHFTTHDGTSPVNSFNGSAISSNQGYTIWSAIWQGSWNWTTILRYLGSGPLNLNDVTEAQPGGDSNNIHQFQNAQQACTVENHYPTPYDASVNYYTQSHAPAYPTQYNRYIFFYVMSLGPSAPSSAATGYMDLKVFDTQTNAVYGTPVVNYSTSSTAWVINTTTTGRPSLIRNTYSSAGNIDIIDMGFANRPYSAAERASVMAWLVSSYT